MLLKLQISQYQAALAVSAMYPQQNLRLSQVVMKIAKYLLDFTGMLMASKQWRVLPSGYYYNNDITVDYPLAFPSAVWGIVITPHDTNKNESAFLQILVNSVNNSSCVLNNSSAQQLNSGYMLCFGT